MARRKQETPAPAAPDLAAGSHKVLNNNVVIAVDAAGRERVLMGRGIGFQFTHEGEIAPDRVEKTFILDQGAEADRTRRLLTEVPYPVIEAVTRAVDEAERSLGRHLGRHVTIGILDHVQFVLERLDEGLRIPATTMPQLRVLHPAEFAAALRACAVLGEELGREFPPEETVFVTMHLLNATRGEPQGSAALLFRRVQHVVDTVERGLGVQLNPETPGYARFVLHVQFLLQRLVDRTMLSSADTSFYEFARHSYPVSHAIAQDVKAYVAAATSSELTDEELLYITVHVERLRGQVAPAATEPEDSGDSGPGTGVLPPSPAEDVR